MREIIDIISDSKNTVKNIHKIIVISWKLFNEYIIEFIGVAVLWARGLSMSDLPMLQLLQSHLDCCQDQPVCFALLQCQWLPPWSHHTLSSAHQSGANLNLIVI